jgi:hypothetical protein
MTTKSCVLWLAGHDLHIRDLDVVCVNTMRPRIVTAVNRRATHPSPTHAPAGVITERLVQPVKHSLIQTSLTPLVYRVLVPLS